MTNTLPTEFVSNKVCISIQAALLGKIRDNWKHRKVLKKYLKEDVQALRFVRNHLLCFVK